MKLAEGGETLMLVSVWLTVTLTLLVIELLTASVAVTWNV